MQETLNGAKSKKKWISQDEIGILMFVAAVIFGGWFRLFPVYLAEFPINDGGLFYRMTETLMENKFYLPDFVPYNGLKIPYSYPPLGFYLAGMISAIFGINLIKIFLYLPAVILILGLWPFFTLANSILESKLQAGLAALIFALLPRSITWMIMGGGITRSLGQLFLVLAALNIYQLFSLGTKKYLVLSILFSSLVCLSHPEAALHTIGIAFLFWFFKGRNMNRALLALGVAGATLLLTAIWWLPVLSKFGMDPFLSAAQTGFHGVYRIIYFLISFSNEPFLTTIEVLAILGFAVKLAQRKYLIPSWYIFPFLVEPRNAPNVSAIPMAFLASIALCDLIFPALAQMESRIRNIEFAERFHSRIEKGVFIFLIVCMLTGMYYYDLRLADRKVSIENQEAFAWVKVNTPNDSKFLVMTGNSDLFADWTLEWFPVLTNRVSLMTLQGREWLGKEQFFEQVRNIQLTQQCISSNSPLECLEIQAIKLDTNYDYIYIAKKTASENYAATIRGDSLIFDLLQNVQSFKLTYKTEEVVIFKVLMD